LFEPLANPLQLKVRLRRLHKPLFSILHSPEIAMHTLKSALVIASLLAAGAAMADTSVVNMDNVRQNQSGSRNTQKLELGTVDGGVLSGGTARVNVKNISQSQSGTSNTQEMIMGKIDKDVKQHTTTVTASNVSQVQSGGSNNTQRIKVGVIE
jgi:hypothetical protein